MPWILVGPHGAMRHLEAAKELLVRFHKTVESRQILFPRSRWVNHAPSAGLQILEDFGVLERKFDFIPVHHLENNDFMAVKAELLKAKRNVFRWFEQIGK